jgi:hypothetical protein
MFHSKEKLQIVPIFINIRLNQVYVQLLDYHQLRENKMDI